jgi:hypothetical protein
LEILGDESYHIGKLQSYEGREPAWPFLSDNNSMVWTHNGVDELTNHVSRIVGKDDGLVVLA